MPLLAFQTRSLIAPLPSLAVVAAFYGLTICRGPYWGDGLELSAAASVLGIAHPTGYPLYTLLGNVFLRLPFGSPGLRMNLLSACSLLVACFFFYWICMELLAITRRAETGLPWEWLYCSFLTIAFGLSLFNWQHAVLAEVYPTFLALFLGTVFLLIRAFVCSRRGFVFASFFLYGLTWQGHLLAILLAPAFLLLVMRLLLRKMQCQCMKNRAKTLLLSCAMFFVGISGYAYLPIRAAQHPPMNWGDPHTLTRLRYHLTGGQYKQTHILSDPQSAQRLGGYALQSYLQNQSLRILAWPAEQFYAPKNAMIEMAGRLPSPWAISFGAFIWILAAGGLALLFWRNLWLALALLASLASGVLVLLVYTIADIDTYFMAIWPLILSLAGVAIAVILHFGRAPKFTPLPAALALVLAAIAARNNYAACDLSHYDEVEKYAQRLLDPRIVPPNSLVLLEGDASNFAAWYMQTVEHYRPDVILFGTSFVVQGWYRHYFEGSQYRNFYFFSKDTPPHLEADYLVVLGGGVIVPNITRRPVFVAPSNPWLEEVLMQSWNGKVVATLLDKRLPPIAAALPGARLIRLHDNPEYRLYQERQFNETYGRRALIEGGRRTD